MFLSGKMECKICHVLTVFRPAHPGICHLCYRDYPLTYHLVKKELLPCQRKSLPSKPKS